MWESDPSLPYNPPNVKTTPPQVAQMGIMVYPYRTHVSQRNSGELEEPRLASLPWRIAPSVEGRNVRSKPRSAVCEVAFCGENNGTPLCYVPDYEQGLQFRSSFHEPRSAQGVGTGVGQVGNLSYKQPIFEVVPCQK